MGKITATKINETYLYIKVEDGDILYGIDDYFALHPKGYEFMPSYKNHSWDGKTHFFKVVSHHLPVGLIDDLERFAKLNHHELKLVNCEKPEPWITRERFEANCKQILAESDYKVRDYQAEATLAALNERRGVLECCTSSGKSLMIYLILRNLMMEKQYKKMLLIVPSIMLVTQMYKDFKNYGWNDVDQYCELQDKDHEPTFKKQILISTWQSLKNQDVSFFMAQECVVVDECLDGETLISTPEGDKRIKDIKVGDIVTSYNTKTGVFEPKRVKEVFENHPSSLSAKMLEIELENGKKVQITENHPVLTQNRGWIRAGELNENDDILELV